MSARRLHFGSHFHWQITWVVGLFAAGVLCVLTTSARPAGWHKVQVSAIHPGASETHGVQIAQHDGYPELRVDGQPFFPNSAAFFYSRIPRHLWESSLDQYRKLGINTIDLYIIWNWHEIRDGELDFDGHTNPRRDLRALLEMIARKGFKLIARPGPTILNEWRNGGYPDWLLAQPAYGMTLSDRLEGRYPPAAERNARDAESAARMWSENPVHMAHARKWLEAVARELAPYRPSAKLRVPQENVGKQKENREPREVSGPLLFVQIEDDLAIGRGNSPGAGFWDYVELLCGVLQQGGVEVPCFVNPTEAQSPSAGVVQPLPIYTMGQWYLPPDGPAGLDERRLTPADLNSLELEAALLGTQPGFPPMLIEYNAGWYAPGDDSQPQPGPASNALLSAGLLVRAGIRGLNWFPLQDTLTPAGFETPWTNRSYRWNSALSLSGSHRERYPAVERVGHQLRAWGRLLAASHRRVDFAIVDPLPALLHQKLPRESVEGINRTSARLLRLADYAGFSADLVDPEHQSPEQLLRYPLLLFPVVPPGEQRVVISEQTQQSLIAYARAGGILVCFPEFPAGSAFEEIQKAASNPVAQLPQGGAAWNVGTGRVLVLSKDFYSWIVLRDEFTDGRGRFEASYAISLLGDLLAYAGLHPIVLRTSETQKSADLMVSELVSNEGTRPLGERSGGQGWISISNLSQDTAVTETLEVLSPRNSVRVQKHGAGEILEVPVTLPPAESLLLPLELPLCLEPVAGHRCEDRIISSGAELVSMERDGKSMLLSFCAPARATVRLHLAEKPGHAEVDENPVPAQWIPEDKELSLDILRGASPGFLRVLRIPLPYTPALPERPPQESHRSGPGSLRFSAAGGVRLPIGADASLLADPPLYVVQKGTDATLRIGVENQADSGTEAQARISGTFDAFAHVYVPGGLTGVIKLPVHAASIETAVTTPPGADGLYRGTLRTVPVGPKDNSQLFFAIVPEKGAIGYTFDFDGDGQPERILETAALRAIVSPEAGGRLIALVDKASDVNLVSTMGMFEDAFAFAPNPPGVRPERARGRYGTFNRPYAAEWIQEQGGPALRLSYDAPDVYPHGARLEKTFRITGARSGSVEYSVSLNTADERRLQQEAEGQIFTATVPEGTPQGFLVLSSIPAIHGEGQATKFCWNTTDNSAPQAPATTVHCESFVPGSPAIPLPPETSRVEIRQMHRPALTIEWGGAGEGARLTLEPKRYSMLLRLSCGGISPGGAPGVFRIEFTVMDGQ